MHIDEEKQIRNVLAVMFQQRITQEEAEQMLGDFRPATLAKSLIDVFNRAEGARALFCDEDGYVDGEKPNLSDSGRLPQRKAA